MIKLPSIYTQEIWERSKNEFNRKYIGKQYVSWSQIESFNDKSGFNTGLLGEFEYLIKYFSKIKFPDLGWGQFGSEAEAYITLRNQSDLSNVEPKVIQELQEAIKNFKDKEKIVLNKIEPLGVFQEEVCYYVEELDIIVLGYIDDMTPAVENNIKLLRDYKTKSESSKKDLHDPKKHQIEIYTSALQQRGLTVENAEYCIVERLGGRECMNGGGRESLFIGERIWYEPYKWDAERLKVTHKMIVETVKKISDLYITYTKYFGE